MKIICTIALAGDVTFAVDNLASYISQIEAGTMRAIARSIPTTDHKT